jgi:gluconate 5-dehydrogenase
MSPLFSLEGKIALVTGGNSGLGLAMAKGLAEQGADLIIVGRDERKLASAETELARTGRRIWAHCFDLHDLNALPHFYDNLAITVGGSIDILVNSAGTTFRAPAVDVTMDKWYEILDLNVSSMFVACQAFARDHIRKNQPGKIINIASLLAERGRRGIAAYAVSKGGVLQLTRSLAIEWAEHRINVNAIGPGYFKTEMTKPLYQDEEFNRWLKTKVPVGRWGKPDELVGTAVFLAASASDFITGQIVYVDGGWMAQI